MFALVASQYRNMELMLTEDDGEGLDGESWTQEQVPSPAIESDHDGLVRKVHLH